ncbi:hypothetical protein GTW69_39760 [Streptomyces sp. SID7760]|nr:hypothetical protein [Streptomyces sp. SID7760]
MIIKYRVIAALALTVGALSAAVPAHAAVNGPVPDSNGSVYTRVDISDLPDYWDNIVDSPAE